MPCSLQALITTSSAAEPAGAAMYWTPLWRQTHTGRKCELWQEDQGLSCSEIDKACAACTRSSCKALTLLARSMLSLKGKKASELTATACSELIQFFFSVSDSSSGTSSYIDFQTSKSGPCRHRTEYTQDTGFHLLTQSQTWHAVGLDMTLNIRGGNILNLLYTKSQNLLT